MIPLSVPSLRGNELKYIQECIHTEWVSSAGDYVNKFEINLAGYTGSAFAVACVNGTAALQVALRIVGVSPGEEVIVPTLTFIATVNAVKYLGADPVFMDCDDFYNIDVEKTAEFLEKMTEIKSGGTFNKETGRRIAAIVPVHVFGNAVNLMDLVPLCRQRNIRIVEDACEALGSVYCTTCFEGRHAGTIGDIGCFSFNGNKIITTGGGGMIVTDSLQYAERARYLTTQAKDDEVRYVHNDIGYNYRLTNIQAAIGVAQMEQLPEFLRIKRENYLRYKEKIMKIEGLNLVKTPPYAHNNHWMYALSIDTQHYSRDRDTLMTHLHKQGIQTRPVWYLNHLQKPYKYCQNYRIEKAYQMLENTLNIPCSVSLQEKDIAYVVEQMQNG